MALNYDYYGTIHEAAEYFAKHAAEIDLVILDAIMPRMSGFDAFRHMKAVDASVRALFISAYPDGLHLADVPADGVTGYLTKPFAMDEFLRAVDRCIGEA